MNAILEGTLVRLAAPDPDKDAEAMARWSQNDEFMRLLDNDPAQPFDLVKVKEEMANEPRPNGFEFIIRTMADDRAIGFVGLFGIRWNHGDTYVGIGIGEADYWGKGYGTEAMNLILRFAFRELNLHRVSLGVFEYNPRAIRSYEKAGFKVEGKDREMLHRFGRYWDEYHMGILRDEWEERQRQTAPCPS